MKTTMKKPTDAAQASYERGILTLDLPRAVQPMLWRQEIKNISNVAFWLAAQDNGEHALLMKISSNSAEQTIARFRDETTAAQALESIREIFINGKPRRLFWLRLLKIIFWFLVIWVVGTFLIQLIAGAMIVKQRAAESGAQTQSALPAVTAQPAAPPETAAAPNTAPAAPAAPPTPPPGQ